MKLKITKICLVLLFSLAPLLAAADTMTSTNYNLINPEFGSGGQLSTSTNYESRDILGTEGDSKSTSANYQITPGFVPPAYPGVPGQPTLTNTSGSMYNTLDFVVNPSSNNPSDVNYAIAISTDNFITTYFVQADDSVGAGTVWQTYSGWGGVSGERLVNLMSNTTYKIKVKARYGPNSETGYSLVATAATVSPTLTMTIAGVSSGISVAGQTTNIATTATTVGFSSLQTGSIKVGAQAVTISTNANAGYSVSLVEDHNLSTTNGATIPAVTATNASPASWPVGITSGRFGYHTTDASLCSGNPTRFSANDTYAAASTTPFEVTCNTGPANSDLYSIVFKVEVESLQASGNYTNKITYIATAQY